MQLVIIEIQSIPLNAAMFIAITHRRFAKLRVQSLHSLSTVHLKPSVDPTVARSNFQITRLAYEGKIVDARHLFDRTPQRDLITWTSLISGYIRCGQLNEARLLFDRSDCQKNVVTWTALLSGYVQSNRIHDAELLFYRIPDKNVVSYNTMIKGYLKNGLVDKACQLFDRMPMRNVVSWNAMIMGLSQTGQIDKAYDLFLRMNEKDVISWTTMVTGLSQNGKIDLAREVFERMTERNVVSWNAMISGYAQNGRVEEAVELFERMPERDMPTWNAMITGLIQNGKLERARNLFEEMGQRNVVSWTTLMTGYIQIGENETTLKLFMEMLIDGISPNEGTFVTVLSAVSNLAGLREGQQLHQMINKSLFQFKPFVDSALINMYSKCGDISMAQKVFELSNRKDLVSWNAIMAAFAHHGHGKKAVGFFKDMQRKGFKPNDVTYIELLSACSHSGLVDEGLMLFKSMVSDGSIEVREDHYSCLIDLCSRAGRLEEAFSLIKELNIKQSSSICGALLGGCNNHGNVKIADLAAKRLLEAEPNNAGTYTLLSNVYALAGRWEEAKKMRRMMKDRGLKKQPGCSWIDVGRGSHVFVVHDKSHSEHDTIYSVVKDLHHKMKSSGCMPSLADSTMFDSDILVM